MEKNRTLNFIDLTIIRQDNRFVMKVYRKDTHTNRYINWNSNVPKAIKIVSIKPLIFRAYDLGTLPEDKANELDFCLIPSFQMVTQLKLLTKSCHVLFPKNTGP